MVLVRSATMAGLAAALLAFVPALSLSAQGPDSAVVVRGDSVIIRLVDVDVRAAIQALGAYVDRPIVFGSLPQVRVTFETPRPVHQADVLALLRGVLESQNLELVTDTVAGLFRVSPRASARPEPAARQPGGPAEQGPLQLFVIRLSHARAADVAATVNALYGRGGALGELGDRRGSLSDELRENRVPPLGQQPPVAPGAQPGGAEQQGTPGQPRQAVLSGDVVIVPDAASNSLLVRASEVDYQLVLAAVEQVDVRPLQVLIEVLIVEARKDRSFSFGVDASVGETAIPNTSNTTASASTTGIGLGDFALKVMGIGGYDVEATLRASAARGDVSIVSRPIVLTANNEPAEILVGSQRPFVQVSRSLPTDAPQRDQVIQYKDVGTQLRVKPTISADGYVMLEVTQEVNAATNEVQFDAPIISTRVVSTRLLIRDGQTIVLGGLTDRQRDRNQGGVPILSSIPLLGGLFGRASRRTTETELFLFLTPRVIRSDQEAEEATEAIRRRGNVERPDR